tara:strand:+ start:484 stop:816 length:333 start_codon:yes stop_codon:yes gene_type:complete
LEIFAKIYKNKLIFVLSVGINLVILLIMKNITKQYKSSLTKYYNLANEILDYTEDYWDMMTYDLEGYDNIFYDDSYDKKEELEHMKKTINTYKHLLKSLQLIKKYGSRYS